MSAIEKYHDPDADCLLLHICTDEHFDYRSIHTFKNLCKDKLDREVHVTVDMIKTRYIDSSGMALLHCLQHWVDAPRVVVRVANCSPELRHIFTSCRLSQHLVFD